MVVLLAKPDRADRGHALAEMRIRGRIAFAKAAIELNARFQVC